MNEETKTLSLIKIFNETQQISKQLPIEIEGGIVIADLLIRCASCDEVIAEELIHGYATHPQPEVASFQAVCICPKCKRVSESVQRIRSIGKRSVKMEKLINGKWVSSESVLGKEGWLKSVFKRIFNL